MVVRHTTGRASKMLKFGASPWRFHPKILIILQPSAAIQHTDMGQIGRVEHIGKCFDHGVYDVYAD
jgi:hypothetical protein